MYDVAMRVEDLDYELPEELIAQHPPERRDGGRLLELAAGAIRHLKVADLAELLTPGNLLVLNDTRVMRARLLGNRESSGGKVELLVLSRDGAGDDGHCLALAKAKRPLQVGESVRVADALLTVIARTEQGAVRLRASSDLDALMEAHGHVPLPPYVRREDEALDRERYQTRFARHLGSAAAPTAGLHLSDELLASLKARGVEFGAVTLHVGLGTFRPVSAPTLSEHVMHRERFSIGEQLRQQIAAARARGAKVVAVGTTVVRALESAASSDGVSVTDGETQLLIAPGFSFRVVDALLTNFHAPRSTLLALVYAFAGQQQVQAAYREAIDRRYRFLSYGDAMWLPTRYP